MPRAVRHINEVRILDRLYRHGVSTRADLARELGLMRSTVGNLIAGLIEQGIVLETEVSGAQVAGKTGRPGQLLRLNARHAAFIGADIGVGHLSVVAVDLAGAVVCSRTVDCAVEVGAVEPVIERLAGLIEDVIAHLPPETTVQGLCLVAPGLVDADGVVLRAPVLGWQQVPLQRLMAERLGGERQGGELAIRTENDANAFAAATLHGPAATPLAQALFVYLDAGVGGAIANAGRLLRGHHGHAGEIGHIHLGERGFESRTAVPGSFESHVAREALLARWRHHGGNDGRGGTLDEVIAALAAGEPAAQRTAAEWAWWMGRGLAALVSVLDPGRIVLGGPLAALFEPVRPAVLAAIAQHLPSPHALPAIEVSPLGRHACAIGGALGLHRDHLAVDERLVYGLGAAG